MRYRFCDHDKGRAGEIPYILLEGLDELLPISKASAIKVYFLSDKKEDTDLLICWRVGDEGILVEERCVAGDKRFKEQLKGDAEFAEKFIDFLLKCPEKKDDRKPLELNGKLSKDEVSEKLRDMIEQIEVWKDALNFQSSKVQNILNLRYGPKVTEDGFYVFVVDRNAFSVSFHPDDFSPEYDFMLLDFKESPEVDENSASWKRLITKILVVLPHDSANEKIANHYDYRAVYREFIKRKKEDEKSNKEKQDKYSIEVDERRKKETKEAENNLRKALLS